MRRIKINSYLAIALISLLASSVIGIQLSSNIISLPDLFHDQHAVEAASLPLAVDYHFKIKEKVGDAKAGSAYVRIDEDFIDSENHCEFCTRIEFVPGPQGEAGIAYFSDKLLDFSKAKSVTFFAMGEEGGEKVKFKVAGKKVEELKTKEVQTSSGPFKELKFALTTGEVSLDNDWRSYQVDLTGADLTGITHPFGIEMSSSKASGAQVFYLKHIIYDTEKTENGLATVQ